MKNQVRNEIFRQISLTLTLPLEILVRPMDAKGLNFLLATQIFMSDMRDESLCLASSISSTLMYS